jgi:hypothetical protein
MKASLCALVLLLCSCVTGTPTPQPATAQSVALRAGDIPGLRRCPQTGSWDSYIAAEKTGDPTDYPNEIAGRDNLRIFGLTDAYISVYSDNPPDCTFYSFAGKPVGRLVYGFTYKFKDAGHALAAFSVNVRDFTVGGVVLDQVQARGGTLSQGPATGLGDLSLIATITVANVTYYTAYWQRKSFEVIIEGFNLPAADGTAAAHRIDGRIH